MGRKNELYVLHPTFILASSLGGSRKTHRSLT